MGINESDLLLCSPGWAKNTPSPQRSLLGDTALLLLGSARPTLDVDYVGTDLAQ